jgi:hypothetical protein
MPIARINLTGTHIQHGYLKVRVDLYPSPANKTYVLHHVDKPIIPPEGYQGEVDDEGNPKDFDDYNAWFESLPTRKELNPCLCHFIKVDPDTTRAELEQIIRDTFDADTVSQLDDALSKDDRREVGRIMKPKAGKGKITDKMPNVNRFKGLEVEVG